MDKASVKVRRGLVATVSAVALATGAAMLFNTGDTAAQQGDADIRVGTYEPELVFNSWPGQDQFMQEVQQMQMEMQQAQQEGDQQRMMEVQQQAQQAQQAVVEEFENAVSDILPELAEEENLDVVAVQVAYGRDGVEEQDITDRVIQELTDGEGPAGQEPLLPDFQEEAPQQQPEQPEQDELPAF